MTSKDLAFAAIRRVHKDSMGTLQDVLDDLNELCGLCDDLIYAVESDIKFQETEQMTNQEKPTTWADMTPEEKGALLLARHNGKGIQVLDFGKWNTVIPSWSDGLAYRVKPEPKRGAVTLNGRMYISKTYPDGVFDADRNPLRAGDTHRITFDTINGDPDCDTIRMGKLT